MSVPENMSNYGHQRQLYWSLAPGPTSNPSIGILFAFVAVIIGFLSTWLLSTTVYKERVNLPYTVLMFLFGIFASLIASNADNQEDYFVVSTKVWMNIDPDLMLYALLPPLLFAEAMTLDSHQIRVAIMPASVLALPGAAFGAYFQGLVCYYMLPYKWSWIFCFMVGSVLSATDPVSVVNMLKGVRGGDAHQRFTYLIVGESLLNDGTALVIFAAIVGKQYSTFTQVAVFLIEVCTVSPFLGVVLGLITVKIMSLVQRRTSAEHNAVQIAATIACAYLSFFIGQYVLHLSGVIACCAAGAMLAWKAKPLILNPESMHIVWHMLEWLGNTLLYALAGLIVGRYSHGVAGKDIACIVIIYITMTLIRLLMLCITYPYVKWFHADYCLKDIVFSTFGGLRGGIALALVLTVEKHLYGEAPEDIEIQETYRMFDRVEGFRAMFIISGVIALTILINGAFSAPFFNWVYSSRPLTNAADDVIFHFVEKRMRRRAREFLASKTGSSYLSHCDATEVEALCSVFQYKYSETPTPEQIAAQDENLKVFKDAENGKTILEFIEDAEGHFTMQYMERESTSKTGAASGERETAVPSLKAADGADKAEQSRPVRRRNSIYKGMEHHSKLRDDLLFKFRRVFHCITTHCYLQHVEEGRLLRHSTVAITLMHASRRGGKLSHLKGMHDIDLIREEISSSNKDRQRVRQAKEFFRDRSVTIFNFFRDMDESYERDRVCLLSCFVEAHKSAQLIFVDDLGEMGFVETPEQLLVLRESNKVLLEAQKMLDSIDKDIVGFHTTEALARMVLHVSEEQVSHFQETGVLSSPDSDVFYDKTFGDYERMGAFHRRPEYIKSFKGLAALDQIIPPAGNAATAAAAAAAVAAVNDGKSANAVRGMSAADASGHSAKPSLVIEMSDIYAGRRSEIVSDVIPSSKARPLHESDEGAGSEKI